MLVVSDPTEIPPPPDKVAPAPKTLIQEEICSEICQSKEQFTQSPGGFSEVPPPSPFYTNACCCQASPERTGEPQHRDDVIIVRPLVDYCSHGYFILFQE